MADDAEFSEFIAQATAPAEAPTTPAEVPPADTPKVESEAAKEPEAKPEVEAKEEEKPAEKQPDWKKAAQAEKAKREAKQASKANEAKLAAQLQAVQAKLARFEAIEAKRETDPLAAAEEFGLSYDKLTKQYIKTLEDKPDGPPPEVKHLTEKIQHIENLLNQQQETINQRAQAEAIQSFQAEVRKVLEAKGDDFELVKAARQGPDLVREIVAAHYRATAKFDTSGRLVEAGELMPTEDACKLAEKYLDEDLGQFKGTKKFSGKVAAKAEEKPAPKKPDAQTLTQDLRQGGTKSEPHGDEVEQLLAMKKVLEAQLNASQGI